MSTTQTPVLEAHVRTHVKVPLDPFLAQYILPLPRLRGPEPAELRPYLRAQRSPSFSVHYSQRRVLPNIRVAEKKPAPELRRRRLLAAEQPAKKPHPELARQLPLDFMKCATDDLICLIYRMLQSLITLNDRASPPDAKQKLTRYHLRTPPAISIQTYLARLTKFNNFSQATLLTTIYYIDLLSHNYQPYFSLNSWTVHRFLLVATMLAQKCLEDFFYTNDHYAKVGGVALTELNCLELDFLARVDWRLVPARQEGGRSLIKCYREVLDLYYAQLVGLMGRDATEHVVYTLHGLESRM